MLSLFIAMLGFVGGHFLLSAPALRSRLVAALGEKVFLGIYSLVSVAFLTWAAMAYRSAPMVPLWELGAIARRIPLVVMPGALILAVAGLTTRSATAVGGERLLDAEEPVNGIFTVTRHPFLWGAGLWAASHLAANGDAASLILFGGLGVLAFGGMPAIDHKRSLGSETGWKRYSARTSLLPFAAALTGRTRIDWRGIGWWRLALAVALYVAIAAGHGWLFGVPSLVL